eukprot:scaffold15799_cov28-Tisochrysis_lutea.AAC.3
MTAHKLPFARRRVGSAGAVPIEGDRSISSSYRQPVAVGGESKVLHAAARLAECNEVLQRVGGKHLDQPVGEADDEELAVG